MWDLWDAVTDVARGAKADYRLEGRALGDGGQAIVTAGVHKPSDLPIAFKRIKPGLVADGDSRARMRREIEYGRTLDHRHVVPVLDADPDSTWFVMPLASGHLEDKREMVAAGPDRLHRLVRHICAGLQAAHDRGWVHRDIKPANILRFSREDKGRWAVADWGLGRGPAGATTHPGRTQVGTTYGSIGFAAPELSTDAHAATPAADIYSVGQLIGWALTGTTPLANIPHLPPTGPWRPVVDAATRFTAAERPQSIEELLALVDEELAPVTESPVEIGTTLLADAKAGQVASGVRLLQLADANIGDDGLFIDVVPRLDRKTIRYAATRHPELLTRVLRAHGRHFESEWGRRPFAHADAVIGFPAATLAIAVAENIVPVATAALETFCTWDESWDRWRPQDTVRDALTRARGDVARAVAAVLRRHPASGQHFSSLADSTQADSRIRQAVRAP